MISIEYYVNLLLIFFQGFILMRAIGCLLKIRSSRFRQALLFIGCFLLNGMVIYIGDLVNLPPTILVFLAAVYFSCIGSFLKKFTISLMFASTMFAYNALSDNFFKGDFADLVYLKFFFILSLSAGIRHFAPDEDYELTSSMWKMLLLLTITPIGIVLSLVLLTDRYNHCYRMNATMYIVLLLLVLFSFVGLLWTVTVLAKQRKLEQKSMLTEINRNYYEIMEQQHFEIRRLKHDMANHLQVLSALNDDKRNSYIEELLHNTAVFEPLNYCTDSTVNAVLTVKAHQMQQYKIRWNKMIDISEELPFEKADICAVFANALDNAMEACMAFLEEEREIILESRARKGLFVLSVKNPCLTELAIDSFSDASFPETSKTDSKNHGLGLRSIKEITNRYGGDMEIKTNDGTFELFLYLPIKK